MELKDISIFSCLNMYKEKAKYVLDVKEVVDWFLKYKISNYQELSDSLECKGFELSVFYRQELEKELYRVRQLIEKSISKGVSPCYSFEAYKSVGIAQELIERIDSHNCGGILIQGTPARVEASRYLTHIQDVSILEMKRLFGIRSSVDLKNGIYDLFDTGRKVPVEKLLSYVDLYDESVIRMIMAGELSWDDYSLTARETDKIEIIRPFLGDIVEYMTSDEFPTTIWGTNTQRFQAGFLALAKERSGKDVHIDIRREQFLGELARNLTFDEASNLFKERAAFCLNEDGSSGVQTEIPLNKFVRARRRF